MVKFGRHHLANPQRIGLSVRARVATTNNLIVQLRLLWWNVDWQSRRTDDQVAAVRRLRTIPTRNRARRVAAQELRGMARGTRTRTATAVVESEQPESWRRLRVLLAVKRELSPSHGDGLRRCAPAQSRRRRSKRAASGSRSTPSTSPTAQRTAGSRSTIYARCGAASSPTPRARRHCSAVTSTPLNLSGGGEIITFGQRPNGTWRKRPTSSKTVHKRPAIRPPRLGCGRARRPRGTRARTADCSTPSGGHIPTRSSRPGYRSDCPRAADGDSTTSSRPWNSIGHHLQPHPSLAPRKTASKRSLR